MIIVIFTKEQNKMPNIAPFAKRPPSQQFSKSGTAKGSPFEKGPKTAPADYRHGGGES